jgi:hypothetical protein
MADTVSKLAAFVFKNGPIAEEILFRDVEEEGEIPGLLPEEREAMDRAEPLLRETWVGILTACREAVWATASGHPAAEVLRTRKTRASTIWDREEVHMPLVPSRVNLGIALSHWGAPEYHVHVWVWTQVELRPLAEAAIAGLEPAPWRNEYGSLLLTLDTPREGESFTGIGERAAKALWGLARPIADAIAAGRAP